MLYTSSGTSLITSHQAIVCKSIENLPAIRYKTQMYFKRYWNKSSEFFRFREKQKIPTLKRLKFLSYSLILLREFQLHAEFIVIY